MDTERTRRLLANPASTQQELEQLVKEALAANERELAFDIRDVIDERFPTAQPSVRGATLTISTFRSTEKHFPTAKEAYVWLIDRFVGAKPDVFTDVRWETTGYVAIGRHRTEEGKAIRNYFARSPEKLFRNSPWLAAEQSNYVRLQNGWYANVNLNNREKFDILCRFGWVVGLKGGQDWDWDVLEPSEGLRDRKERIALAEKLFAELEAFVRESDPPQAQPGGPPDAAR
jgi:hypothetical protein